MNLPVVMNYPILPWWPVTLLAASILNVLFPELEILDES